MRTNIHFFSYSMATTTYAIIRCWYRHACITHHCCLLPSTFEQKPGTIPVFLKSNLVKSSTDWKEAEFARTTHRPGSSGLPSNDALEKEELYGSPVHSLDPPDTFMLPVGVSSGTRKSSSFVDGFKTCSFNSKIAPSALNFFKMRLRLKSFFLCCKKQLNTGKNSEKVNLCARKLYGT